MPSFCAVRLATAPVPRARLDVWLRTALGAAVRQRECERVGAALADRFGFHLLQLGRLDGREAALDASRIGHRIVGDASAEPGVAVQLDPEALPFAGESLDVVVLAHVLEFAAHPHAVLREVERVLVGGGSVLVMGFNPHSLFGLPRWWRRTPPWNGRFIAPGRLADWLELLGLTLERQETCFFLPPVGQRAVLARLQRLEGWGRRWWPRYGGVYLMVARKRVATLTPVRPRWRPRRLLAPGLAKPTLREGS